MYLATIDGGEDGTPRTHAAQLHRANCSTGHHIIKRRVTQVTRLSYMQRERTSETERVEQFRARARAFVTEGRVIYFFAPGERAATLYANSDCIWDMVLLILYQRGLP